MNEPEFNWSEHERDHSYMRDLTEEGPPRMRRAHFNYIEHN